MCAASHFQGVALQTRLRPARVSVGAGHRWHSCEQHRRLQRLAGTRHVATHAGGQGHLEGQRYQRYRLVTQLYPAASGSVLDLGSRRAANGVCGDCSDRGDDRRTQRQRVARSTRTCVSVRYTANCTRISTVYASPNNRRRCNG